MKKRFDLYEVETIDNQNIIAIAFNPKEYFEKYENKNVYKKHKGIIKGTAEMNFEILREQNIIIK